MPRKGHISKREVAPDPVYGSTLVTKFVNSMMWGGKKSTAQGIFYTAMKNLEEKGGGDDALKLFKKAVVQRQLQCVLSQPPTGGPRMGATSAGQVRMAMARTMPSLGVSRNTTSRPTGTIIAPPRPWMVRETVKVQRLLLAAHRSEASEHHDGGCEDPPRPMALGGPAADRNEHRQCDQVGGHAHREMRGRRVELRRHRRQRRGDHRRVEILHEKHRGHQQRGGGPALDGRRIHPIQALPGRRRARGWAAS